MASQSTLNQLLGLPIRLKLQRAKALPPDSKYKKVADTVKSIVSVREPSAQAMKAMKAQSDEACRRHGVDPRDPVAAAKMHMPLGTLPPGVTTSTSGPMPEERLAKEQLQQQEYRKHGSMQSVSSSGGSSSTPSIRGMNQVAPWEN